MQLKTKIKKICRLHNELVELMQDVYRETDGGIDFFDRDWGDDIPLVKGLTRIAEELDAGIMEGKGEFYVTCEGAKINSMDKL